MTDPLHLSELLSDASSAYQMYATCLRDDLQDLIRLQAEAEDILRDAINQSADCRSRCDLLLQRQRAIEARIQRAASGLELTAARLRQQVSASGPVPPR